MLIVNIDDDEDERDLFQYAIRSVDPSITCKLFSNGEAFFSFIEQTKVLPDFVFLDINMPKENGYAWAAAIRADERLMAVRIIMYSTYFNATEQAKYADLELEFLRKPNKMSDLTGYIKDLILPDKI